jgi:hypothetical protein
MQITVEAVAPAHSCRQRIECPSSSEYTSPPPPPFLSISLLLFYILIFVTDFRSSYILTPFSFFSASSSCYWFFLSVLFLTFLFVVFHKLSVHPIVLFSHFPSTRLSYIHSHTCLQPRVLVLCLPSLFFCRLFFIVLCIIFLSLSYLLVLVWVLFSFIYILFFMYLPFSFSYLLLLL